MSLVKKIVDCESDAAGILNLNAHIIIIIIIIIYLEPSLVRIYIFHCYVH